MSENAPNLLDLLDELRDLAPDEQERKLANLPPSTSQQLRGWLKMAQRPADPFDAVANALAGADQQLLATLRTNLSRLRNEGGPIDLKTPSKTTLASPNDILPLRPSITETAPSGTRLTPDGRLAFQAGDVLMRQFRIVCQLGRGGMGEVFRAIDENAGEQVALKFLPADRMANPEMLKLLKSEVRVAHLVRSPFVCAVHGLYIDVDAMGRAKLPPFIAMQFIEGEDLHTLLKRVERIAGPKVVRIAHELAKGMSAIHAAGILHRDLKPSNVMLDVHGTVQILDFGIAAIAQPAAGDKTPIAGTPAYMAPEARTQPATVASDIYALGLLLFELITGQMASQLIADGFEPVQTLEQFKDQVPRGLMDAIIRCLRFNPNERFASMEELLAALPAPTPIKGRRESISTIAKSDAVSPLRPWAIGAMIAFIIIAGIGVLMIPARPGSAPAHLPRDPAELLGGVRRFAGFFGSQDDPYFARGFAIAPPDASAPAAAGSSATSLYFWYRSSAKPLEPQSAVRGLSVSDPATGPGMTTIIYEPDEVLREAWRQPDATAKADATEETVLPPNIGEMLSRRTIGLMNAPMKLIDADQLPAGWTAPVKFPGGTKFWIEPSEPKPLMKKPLVVAMFGAQLVYLGRPSVPLAAVISSAAASVESKPGGFSRIDQFVAAPAQWLKQHTTQDLAFWWMYALPLFGLGLAIRNIRMRRCDTHHALRVAGVVFFFSLVGWILLTRPSVTGKMMNERWNTGIGIALFIAAQAWISYAAVDPYARLTWKRCLIGYARFTAAWPSITRDAIVGRSILSGVSFGLTSALLLKTLDRLSPSVFAAARDQLAASILGDGIGTAGLMFRFAASSIVFSLLQFVTLVLLHWITRRKLVAIVLFCIVTPLLWAVYRNDFGFPGYLIYPMIGILTAIALIHEGVLTMAIGIFFSTVLTTVPLTFNNAEPQFGISVAVMLLLFMVALTGGLAVIPRGITSRWWPSDPITREGTNVES